MSILTKKFAPAALAVVTAATPSMAQAQGQPRTEGPAPQARPAPVKHVNNNVASSFKMQTNGAFAQKRKSRPKPLYSEVNNPVDAFALGFLNRWMGTGLAMRVNSAIYRALGNTHEAKMQEAMAVCTADDIRNSGFQDAYKAGSVVGAAASVIGPPSFKATALDVAVSVGFEIVPQAIHADPGASRLGYAATKAYQHRGTYAKLPGSAATYGGARNLAWDAARVLALADDHQLVKCTAKVREQARRYYRELRRKSLRAAPGWVAKAIGPR